MGTAHFASVATGAASRPVVSEGLSRAGGTLRGFPSLSRSSGPPQRTGPLSGDAGPADAP